MPGSDSLTRLTPIGMQRRARIRQLVGIFVVLTGIGLVGLGWWWESWQLHESLDSRQLRGPLAWGGGIVLALLFIRFFGWLATHGTDPVELVWKPPLEPPAKPHGTIIVCSGGGIKSAAFCLGGLQRLDAADIYEKAKAIVAVSGGGYIAAAYATLRFRRKKSEFHNHRILGAGGPEEAVLRTRTNYLASSARVKFNLIASAAVGIAVNLAIAWAVARVLAWLIARHASSFSGAPKSGYEVVAFIIPLAIVFPLALLLAATTVFLVARGLPPILARRDPNRRAGRRVRAKPLGSALVSFLGELPSRLALGAGIYFIAFIAVPWFARLDSSVWSLDLPDIGGNEVAVLSAAVTLTTALIGATVKGSANPDRVAKAMRARGKEPHWSAVVVRRFGRLAAPLLGVLLVVVTFGFVVCSMLNDLTAHPSIRNGWSYLVPPAIVLAAVRIFIPADHTSMYPFYRDQLGWAYLQIPPGGQSPSVTSAEKKDKGRAKGKAPLPSDIEPTVTSGKTEGNREAPWPLEVVPSVKDVEEAGGPELVLCATVNVTDPAMLPAGRSATPIIFSRDVGLTDPRLPGGQRLMTPHDYHAGGGPAIGVDSAIAMSGAAVSPLAGREDKSIGPSRLLLALANVRLGVWIRNPYWTLPKNERLSGNWRGLARKVNLLIDHASALQVVREALGSPSIYEPYLYITDGGHYDNLGLVEALRRRPSRIIVLDGSGDTEDEFPTMGQAIATARIDQGVDVRFDPAPLQRGKRKQSDSGFVKATACYPNADGTDAGGTCEIFYFKCVLAGDLTWDIHSYGFRHQGFPAWANEFEIYDDFDFEAYRQLGFTLVDQAIEQQWQVGSGTHRGQAKDGKPRWNGRRPNTIHIKARFGKPLFPPDKALGAGK